ncbi:MAG TPA: hypothetical protein PLR64_00540 [Candidatus Dojkabacteria bacterium]|nr:hypothetical protein [Candidatus Dojkabacteria bacterium]
MFKCKVTVSNMTSPNSGREVSNQFIVRQEVGNSIDCEYFQSYNTIIVKRDFKKQIIYLDKNSWNYSKTTGKYRNRYLGETIKETRENIKSGRYILADLN